MHELLRVHKDDPEKLGKVMNTLGIMYHNLHEDYARAAFWWRRAGAEKMPASEFPRSGVHLAECYYLLGVDAARRGEFAQAMAARVLRESPPGDVDRIRFAFRLLLARNPSEFESKRLSTLLADQRRGFDASPEDAVLFMPKGAPKELDAKEFAAWTMTARVLLNLDEFMTRE